MNTETQRRREMNLERENKLSEQIIGAAIKVPLNYKGQKLKSMLRLDLLVEDTIVVELKASSELNPIYKSQLLTYVRLLKVKLGLVINLGQPRLVEGVSRVLNNTLYALRLSASVLKNISYV